MEYAKFKGIVLGSEPTNLPMVLNWRRNFNHEQFDYVEQHYGIAKGKKRQKHGT